MEIVTRSEWGARYARGFRGAPIPASELYLHHSVTPAVNGPAAVRNLETIGQSRFKGGISYTFAITPDGTVYDGHGVDRQGAHTGGRNTIARAICLIGNYDTTKPSDAMVNSVVDLVIHGYKQGWWKLARLTGGHRDAPGASTACPGKYAYALIPHINSLITQRLNDSKTTNKPTVPTNTPSNTQNATKKGDNVLDNFPVRGKGTLRLNVSIAPNSVALAEAWIITSVNGPSKGSARIWFQKDAGGISDVNHEMTFANGLSQRKVSKVPNLTTMVNINYDFPDGGCITLEGISK